MKKFVMLYELVTDNRYCENYYNFHLERNADLALNASTRWRVFNNFFSSYLLYFEHNYFIAALLPQVFCLLLIKISRLAAEWHCARNRLGSET